MKMARAINEVDVVKYSRGMEDGTDCAMHGGECIRNCGAGYLDCERCEALDGLYRMPYIVTLMSGKEYLRLDSYIVTDERNVKSVYTKEKAGITFRPFIGQALPSSRKESREDYCAICPHNNKGGYKK